MTAAAEPLLAIVGPTASGKSEAAIAVAEALGAEIVSVDSMLVYRGMDVGTAKPSPEDRARVPHHLIDVVGPSGPFTVARYRELAEAAVRGIRERGRRVLLVGGSGLYFRAVVDRLAFPGTDPRTRAWLEAEARVLGAERLHARLREVDPVAAARIEPANVRRTVRALEVAAVTGQPFSAFAEDWERYEPGRVRAAGIEIAREVLAARIEARVRAMVEGGLLEEVRRLVERGLGRWLTASQAIGYAEFARHLAGELTLEEAIASTVRRTKELARRQMVWFRRDPRIRWFRAGPEGAVGLVDELVEYLR
ncbi:tRNA dimethylallyltransferase [bacterium HR12]|nr:tRNA dimethylallyltransferase [bacterium HR12]